MADRPTGVSRPEAQKPLSTHQPPPFQPTPLQSPPSQPPPKPPPPEPPPPQTQGVLIGKALETGQEIRLGDVERRSGLYILGKPGMGKSALMVNMAIEDLYHGHKIFFLDPHGYAISEFVKRFYAKGKFCAYLFDPENKEYAFGINLLSCTDQYLRQN